jgi:hypothetical protein
LGVAATVLKISSEKRSGKVMNNYRNLNLGFRDGMTFANGQR